MLICLGSSLLLIFRGCQQLFKGAQTLRLAGDTKSGGLHRYEIGIAHIRSPLAMDSTPSTVSSLYGHGSAYWWQVSGFMMWRWYVSLVASFILIKPAMLINRDQITEFVAAPHVQSDSSRFVTFISAAFLSLVELPADILAYKMTPGVCVTSSAKAETDATSLTIKSNVAGSTIPREI